MSDYLWDKTGEPEEDVAQLENLLGTLKYRPRPLEIPATDTPATTAAARTRPATIFSRPRLALAASLLLTLLAGSWLLTRQGEPQKNQIAAVGQGSTTNRVEQTAIAPQAGTNEHAPVGKVEPPKPGRDRAFVVAASVPKARPVAKQLAAQRQKKPQPRSKENNAVPREEIVSGEGVRWQVDQPLTPQQREATEQLMLALRLASAKLNYAQREMQEIGRAGK